MLIGGDSYDIETGSKSTWELVRQLFQKDEEKSVTYLGKVTSGKIKLNDEDWGNVNDWKEKYENAIANLLAGHESEHALAAL